MNRRGFLGSILALAAAPAIVRAQSLMPVRRLTPAGLWLPRDPGFARGVLQVYSGIMPANADAPVNGSLLVEIPLPLRYNDPDTPAAGFAIDSPQQAVVQASGSYGYARAILPEGVIDMGPREFILSNKDLWTGSPITLDTFQFFRGDPLAPTSLRLSRELRQRMLDGWTPKD